MNMRLLTATALALALSGFAAAEDLVLFDATELKRSLVASPGSLLIGAANAQYEINAEGPKSYLLNGYVWSLGVTGGSLTGAGIGAGYRRYISERLGREARDFTGPFAQALANVSFLSYGLDEPFLGDEGSSVILEVGPMVGWKWVLQNRITLEVAGGIQLGVGNIGSYRFSGLYGAGIAGVGYSW